MKLKEGLLDKNDAFNLYLSTASPTDESHRSDFHYLVAFRIRLLEFKNAMERSHATFSRALRKRRQQPPVRGDAAERESLGAPAKEPPKRAGDFRQTDAKKVRSCSTHDSCRLPWTFVRRTRMLSWQCGENVSWSGTRGSGIPGGSLS
jgi:hypothetical protein